MIYFFGDLHGAINLDKFDASNFEEGYSMHRDDYVIILGDFGIPWNEFGTQAYEYEMNKLKSILGYAPWTTLFLDGNHENFNNLEMFPTENKFGGKIGVIEENIYHLLRGEIYTLQNKTFFTFGGGTSLDKKMRIFNISWWEQEAPTRKEIKYALDNLDKHNNKVDYILTHAAPDSIVKEMFGDTYIKNADPVQKFLDVIKEKVTFKRWFFGHYHKDWSTDPSKSPIYYGLMNNYKKLDEHDNLL